MRFAMIATLLALPAFLPSAAAISHDVVAAEGGAWATVTPSSAPVASCNGSVFVTLVEQSAQRTLTIRWELITSRDAPCLDYDDTFSGVFEGYQGSRLAGYSWSGVAGNCFVDIHIDPPAIGFENTYFRQDASCSGVGFSGEALLTVTPGV
jgi:hypothetical protein